MVAKASSALGVKTFVINKSTNAILVTVFYAELPAIEARRSNVASKMISMVELPNRLRMNISSSRRSAPNLAERPRRSGMSLMIPY